MLNSSYSARVLVWVLQGKLHVDFHKRKEWIVSFLDVFDWCWFPFFGWVYLVSSDVCGLEEFLADLELLMEASWQLQLLQLLSRNDSCLTKRSHDNLWPWWFGILQEIPALQTTRTMNSPQVSYMKCLPKWWCPPLFWSSQELCLPATGQGLTRSRGDVCSSGSCHSA